MAKNDKKRTRTMVYSNVNKKAGKKSASNGDGIINLDNEIVIGLKTFPEPDVNKKNKVSKTGQAMKNRLDDKKNDNNEKNVVTKKIEFKGEPKTTKLNKQQQIQIQKRKILIKIGIIFLFLICLIGGIVYFFLSPVFNIKKIQVINNINISSEQIINISEIHLNENTFKFSKKEVKDKISSNPYIESVEVKRNVFSNQIQIDVKERIASLMLEYGNSYVYINNQGYILEVSTIKIDAPIIKGYTTLAQDIKPGNRLNNEDLERLESVLKILEAAQVNDLDKLITNIDVSDMKNYVIYMELEDKTIYIGNGSDLFTQMLYIKEMVERERGKEGEFFVNRDLNKYNPVFREKV